MSCILVDNQYNTNMNFLYHHPLAGRSCCRFHTWPKDARVFEAHHESNASRSVVVKDVWLEDDRIEEGVHLENIRSATSQMQTKGTVFPGKRDPSTYFLTVVAHGRVKVGGQTVDHTTNVMTRMRGSGLPSDLEYFSMSKPESATNPGFPCI